MSILADIVYNWKEHSQNVHVRVIAASICNNDLKIREMANEQYLLSHPACPLRIHRDTADQYTRFLEVFYEPL